MTTSTVHLYSNHISLNGTTDTPSTEIKAKGLHMTYCIKEKKKTTCISFSESLSIFEVLTKLQLAYASVTNGTNTYGTPIKLPLTLLSAHKLPAH